MYSRPGLFMANILMLWFAAGPGVSGAELTHTAKARDVLERLKRTRVISIQDYDKINAIDQEGMAGVWGDSPVNEYDRDYRRRLKEFLGVELILVRSDCLVTQTIGSLLTEGRQGFVGDVLNDWAFSPIGSRPQNVMVIGHCGAPITPWSNKRIPYLIRDHIHSDKRWFGPEDVPTATTVYWPADEPATVVKFDVFRKHVSVFTGNVLDGDMLYDDFANCICRNQMVVQIAHPDHCYLLPSDPHEGAFRNWWGSWGCHQVAFYGDLSQPVREFAARAGFEVVGDR